MGSEKKMKFGKRLEGEVFPGWKYYAVDYKTLKKKLPADESDDEDHATGTARWSSDDAMEFIVSLDAELDKVFAFCNLKRGELNRRIDAMETTIAAIANPASSNNTKEDQADSNDHDDDEQSINSTDATRTRLEYVDEEIGKVTGEVKELAKFAGLNHTAFKKILKKHDKRTEGTLKTDYLVRLNTKPFFEETYESMILRLSDLWDQVRYFHGGASTKDKSPGVDAQNIVRKTTKYWVHLDNVMEVKLLVLKHLPVLLFKKGVPNDPALNSIYFDNDELFLYHSRMRREEQAQNLRFRWYGKRGDSDEVWVERKTHHEDWTGARSIKERFPIKEKYLNDFLAGKYDIRHTTDKLRKEKKKKPKDIDDMERLADDVQTLVLSRRLRPMIRTSYNRTAFQLPADARVRISLDTELCMVREDGPTRSGTNWRRNDNGYPFSELPKEDVIKFPYAVLEIKLQTQFGQAAPKWATDLAASHLVEAVPKFSKFHHAISMFYTSKVEVVPFWFYQMDKSILKPKPIEWVKKEDEEFAVHDGAEPVTPDSSRVVKVDKFGKVFFSNERTFLRWLNLCMKILTLSIFLLNFGPTNASRLAGGFVTIVACAVLLWSLIVFQLRAYALRSDISSGFFAPFHVPSVPTLLVLGFMAGLATSIYMQYTPQ